MTDTTKLHVVQSEPGKVPADASDLAGLFETELGDPITETRFLDIAANKPRDFFRTHPDKLYRPRTEIYSHKVEGVIEVSHYIIAPNMRGRIEEARPCTLVAVAYRDGTPRLWPIPMPREGERDNETWISARAAARAGLSTWVKLVWARRSYKVREAQPGYAPDPKWADIPPFEELVRLAFGEHGIIRDENHPIYRELFGAPASGGEDGDTI
jgi:hypothetical protein